MRFGSLTDAESASWRAQICDNAKDKCSAAWINQVAGERQFESAASRHTIDTREYRLVEVAQSLQSTESTNSRIGVRCFSSRSSG